MHYCVKCGVLVAARWGQRPICPTCREAEEAAKVEPEPAEEAADDLLP